MTRAKCAALPAGGWGECRLFHFAGVLRAANEPHALFEVDDDAGLGIGSVFGRVGLKAGREQDGEFGRVFGGRMAAWPQAPWFSRHSSFPSFPFDCFPY